MPQVQCCSITGGSLSKGRLERRLELGRWRSLRIILARIAIVFCCCLVSPAPTQAQAAGWTDPWKIFETEGRASEAEIVGDPSGVVHVFWAYGAPGNEDSGTGQAIYYARKHDGAWSEPVDVLVSPGGRGARMHAVAVDIAGYLHVVWSGGDALYYSRAFAPEAGSATGWTSTKALISGVSALEPAIALGPDDALYAVWTQARSGLAFTHSEDSGTSWATPQVIYPADGEDELARWGRLAVDGAGRIHAVLTYTVNDPEAQYGRSDANLLYYLRSDDGGDTWSEPFLVTPEPDFGEINVATFGADRVHLVWNGRAGRHGRYHRWSQDGGATWSDIQEVLAPAPRHPLGDGGLTGFPALAVDATGTLHMVSATGGGDYYFRWTDGDWTPPVLISPGLDGSGVTQTVNSLEQPSIAISGGSQLHAVFHDGFERIWYTSTAIDAPAETPLPLPTIAAPVEATATATASPTPSPEPHSTPAPLPGAMVAQSSSPLPPLLEGAAPAVLLVLIVIVAYGRRLRH